MAQKAHPHLFSWFTRDRFLLGFGAAGVVWETIAQQGERPTLLILFAACLGFPVFLKADEAKKNGVEKNGEKP